MISIRLMIAILFFLPRVLSHDKPAPIPDKPTPIPDKPAPIPDKPAPILDKAPIPEDKSQLNTWFQVNVKPYTERKDTLDPSLVEAESHAKVIKVKADGSCPFKTVAEAISSIPKGNKDRVIVWIGGGNYTENIKIGQDKPFVTLYGDPNDMPTLSFGGHGTTSLKSNGHLVANGTLTVESDYFSAVNIIMKNTAQAAAMRIGGDMASFYNCKFDGFQGTLCERGRRLFFKDCYIKSTIDFLFGIGKSLYLNVDTHVIPGDTKATVNPKLREFADSSDTGYSFVHCNLTGSDGSASSALRRAAAIWKPLAKVVFAYSEMNEGINLKGGSNNLHPKLAKNMFFGEYKNKGPGCPLLRKFISVTKLTSKQVKPFITLAFVEGSKWLLPPATV